MYKVIETVLFILITSVAFANDTLSTESDDLLLTLPTAVDIAVENHASVKAAKEKAAGAVYESKSTWADMFFKVSAGYSYTKLEKAPFQNIDMGPSGIMKAQVAHEDQYHWDVTLVQPLFAGFALTTQHHMATLDCEVKKQQQRQAVLDVIQGVKTAYYNVLLIRKILHVADDAVKTLQAHESDATKLYDGGIIRYNDLLSAQVALANVIQDREKARAGAQMALSDLNRWLACDINRKTDPKDFTEIPLTYYQFETLINEGMKNRPILKVLRFGLEILEGAIQLEKSAYYPEIVLVGRYQQDGDNPAATDNDFSNDYNTSITIEGRWTFFEWGKTRAKVNKVDHDKRELEERIKEIEDSIKLEIKKAWLNLNVAEKNIETAKTSLGRANENWRITNLGYKQQVTTSTEVLDARTDLTQADTNYYQALYGYLSAKARLDRATGKGPEI